MDEEQQFLNALQSSLEIFVNRMKSNSARGRSIANDSSVQTLFMTINAMHPQLMKYIGEQEDARGELCKSKPEGPVGTRRCGLVPMIFSSWCVKQETDM